MSNVTVNISFQDGLLDEIDAEAKRESRSRSELIREAARTYVKRQTRWDQVFELGDRVATQQRLTEADVMTAVKEVRGKSRKKK